MENHNVQGVQTLDRAFDIIELLSTHSSGMGVTEIGRELGLHKSTVHRLVNALVYRGYLEKDKNKGLYKIGLKFIEVSSLHIHQIELKTEAMPFMRHLAESTGQVAHLAILDETEIVYIEKIDVVQSLRMYSQIGERIPVYCSALGKVLLANLDVAYRNKIVQRINFVPYTENTIVDKEQFILELGKTKQRGWAIDNQEHESGIRCIAAPIKDFTGRTIAALSITGNISQEKERSFIKMMIETASNISRQMGYFT
ncbi:MAG TPA: IclR family transcriptional regulator [Thermoclostridium sp.]|nr:IclR family transcriptional regulator [Thermoclostridium sp.]